MHLRNGIPTLDEIEELKRSDLFRRHLDFNRTFIDRHKSDMADYGGKWALDQLRLWSRRWEYPFVAQRLIDFAGQGRGQSSAGSDPERAERVEGRAEGRIRILDAGCGVTYFPYFVVDQLPAAEFTCCDYDPSYAAQFERINQARGESRVKFLRADLRQIPLPDRSLDAICCISVLEHTDEYGRIIDEFSRVLKSGGLFVLTFDLSLDGKFALSQAAAGELLGKFQERFLPPPGTKLLAELDRMRATGILTTDSVRHTEPDLLPWSRPVRAYKAVRDLLSGRGWTGGFRSLSVFCIDALNR